MLTYLPGAYSLQDKNGHEIRRLVVNLPAQESNAGSASGRLIFEQQLCGSPPIAGFRARSCPAKNTPWQSHVSISQPALLIAG